MEGLRKQNGKMYKKSTRKRRLPPLRTENENERDKKRKNKAAGSAELSESGKRTKTVRSEP